MSAVRMDGKALSAKVRGSILAETEELKKKGVTPGLAVIIVGNDPASEIYVRNKERACEQCGFYSEKYALPEETSQEELLGLIAQLNESPQISGILCQMPVPKHISEQAVIDAIASDSPYAGPVKMKMDLGVDVLPKFSKDTTDRNRTSPFAFTGNKFEFRMPGSAENLSDCNTILNTAVAKELKGYADELEKADDFTSAAIALVKRTIRDHRRVIFNGNGYTAEWEEEAARRGLPNKKNTPAALPALVDPKNIQLMEDFGVLTKVEMESRYEVEMEHYAKIINIEALTMLEMARKQLLPAVNSYMSEVANTAATKLAVSEALSVRSETKTLTKLSTDADAMSDAIDVLQDVVDAAEALTSESEKAVAFHDNVIPAMDALRAAADDAETICGEDYWPLPSYSKMLYYV